MDGFATVTLEKHDGLAWITLDRPSVHNAINLAMRDELWSAIEAVELDPDIGVAIFRGAGQSAFSSGADLKDFGTATSFTEARRGRLERDIWARLVSFEKPLIAAVQGYALGAGCELSLYCDFRIASEDAQFGLPEVKLGYLPSAGGTQMLPRLVGQSRALDMICSGESIPARRALDYGLIREVVTRNNLYPAAESLALRLLAMPQKAVRLAKKAVLAGLDLRLDEGLQLEARLRGQLL